MGKIQKLSTNSYEIFWRVGYLADNKSLDFGAYLDHEPGPEINDIFTIAR